MPVTTMNTTPGPEYLVVTVGVLLTNHRGLIPVLVFDFGVAVIRAVLFVSASVLLAAQSVWLGKSVSAH